MAEGQGIGGDMDKHGLQVYLATCMEQSNAHSGLLCPGSDPLIFNESGIRILISTKERFTYIGFLKLCVCRIACRFRRVDTVIQHVSLFMMYISLQLFSSDLDDIVAQDQLIYLVLDLLRQAKQRSHCIVLRSKSVSISCSSRSPTYIAVARVFSTSTSFPLRRYMVVIERPDEATIPRTRLQWCQMV